MRVSAVVLASFVLAAPSLFALEWSTHGPNGGAMAQVAISPAAPRVVYAAGGAGVFRSDDACDTWRNVSGPFHDVTLLVVDPKNADVLFAATAFNVYKSTNGGASWRDLTSLFSTVIRPSALVIDPTSSSTVYLASRCGPIGFSVGLPAQMQAVVPTGDPFLGAGVYQSTDGGVTWSGQVRGLDRLFSRCVEELSLDPAVPQHLFATPSPTDGGYSESYDGGVTWTRAPSFVPGRVVVDDATLGLTRYGVSASSDGFLKSADGGLHWSFSYQVSGIPPSGFNDLAQDPATGRLFVATGQGLFRSGDGGEAWVDTGAPPVPTASVYVNRAAGYVFAANAVGLYRSSVSLGAWQRLDVGDPSTQVQQMVTDLRDPATLYALIFDYQISASPYFSQHGRIFVSHDSTGSWQLLRENDYLASASMAVDPGGDLYVNEGDGFFRYSADSGTWTQRTNPPASQLAADPRQPGILYAFGGFASAFGVSNDGGQTWTSSVIPVLYVQNLVVDPSTQPSTIYVGGSQGMGKSTNGGLTWATIPQEAFLLAIAPSKPSRLYSTSITTIGFGQAIGLFRSDDAGGSWTLVTLPDKFSDVSALAADPHDAQSLWITEETTGRVFHSEDAGATWADAGFPDRAGNGLALAADSSHVFATKVRFGVWSAALPPSHHRRALTTNH